MKTLLCVLVLCGCGASPVYVEPVDVGGSAVTVDSSAPLDCRATCLRVKEQLVRDFGVTEADCGAPAFARATDCRSCQAVFRETYGVQLTTCR